MAWEPDLFAAMGLPIPVALVDVSAEGDDMVDPAPPAANAAETLTA